ncbi:TetR/AcrR family transcriptional regulator [Pseudomonas sp. PA27(2017)]|uniref:TetR/AcrR family transcriptional regulator n=1 Tax=Pseudomonas sp. PA27(2017) TaxID=1932112 RepID=UPI000AD170BF|nr:TetR/AcrR family transcriptional regulator [Pseudomonas sp. PA27(2017)]
MPEREHSASPPVTRRLAKAERRSQLLETARQVIRREGADRLTLGHLAKCAGVSKPVVYDHFATRSALLIELYRWIDIERVNAFRELMAGSNRSLEDTTQLLANAYIECAANNTDEFYAVGAALAGSDEKAAVFQELLDNCVQMFVSVLTPHAGLPAVELERRCTGLVGAGEALAGALVRGRFTAAEAINSFTSLIRGSLQSVG